MLRQHPYSHSVAGRRQHWGEGHPVDNCLLIRYRTPCYGGAVVDCARETNSQPWQRAMIVARLQRLDGIRRSRPSRLPNCTILRFEGALRREQARGGY